MVKRPSDHLIHVLSLIRFVEIPMVIEQRMKLHSFVIEVRKKENRFLTLWMGFEPDSTSKLLLLASHKL